MSTSLISHNADLTALVQAGYKVRVCDGYLVVKDIPYLTAEGEICKGDIVTSLELTGNETGPPSDHTVWWSGGIPHTADGESMEQHLSINRWDPGRELGEGINVCMHWSRKPKTPGGGNRGYTDYQKRSTPMLPRLAVKRRPSVLAYWKRPEAVDTQKRAPR